jgi:N-acetylneuraminic acid mutarotase
MRNRVRRVVASTAHGALIASPVPPSTVAGTLPGSWERLADAPRKRQEASYVTLAGKLHLLGWSRAHKVYNPANDSWSGKAKLPAKLNHVQAVALDGKIYVIGGLTSWPDGDVNTVYIYNGATNKWSQGARMPRGRGAGGIAVRNGKIYYAGGLNGGTAVPWFDVYDPAADSWSSLPNMPRAREHFHAAVAGGKLWAIGGRQGPINSTVAQTDAFNFSTGQWQTGFAPIPTKRGGFGVGVAGDEVIVFGGEGGGVHPEVEAYDATSDTWRALQDMAKPRHGFQVAECGGAFYIATGSIKQGGGGATPYHDVFRLASGAGCG